MPPDFHRKAFKKERLPTSPLSPKVDTPIGAVRFNFSYLHNQLIDPYKKNALRYKTEGIQKGAVTYFPAFAV
ncbi:MAG: hypothetical protein J1E38_06995, partial [Paramuribaculum sp.]|nr:hypothetical protein [Paramuribaculum sp.]